MWGLGAILRASEGGRLQGLGAILRASEDAQLWDLGAILQTAENGLLWGLGDTGVAEVRWLQAQGASRERTEWMLLQNVAAIRRSAEGGRLPSLGAIRHAVRDMRLHNLDASRQATVDTLWRNLRAIRMPASRRWEDPVLAGYQHVADRDAVPVPERRTSTLEQLGSAIGETAVVPRSMNPVTAARGWAARLVDRPSSLFAAGLRRYGAGDLRLPHLGGQLATHQQIADWVRENGWRPGQAVQFVWPEAEHPLGPVDELLLTAIAGTLHTRVYAPEGAASVSNRERDVIATRA
ncbi:hypothetical protein ACFXKJ_41930, partial [Kitasatospora indigofera]|uniref:hypothetical protein n=1 Tax=Kitasatospora indigofera TaxID=67307 RepID=UPI0036A43193